MLLYWRRRTWVESGHLAPGSCSMRLDHVPGATQARTQGTGCRVWAGDQEEKGLIAAVQGPVLSPWFSKASC